MRTNGAAWLWLELSSTSASEYPIYVRVNAICPGIIDTPMQASVLTRLAELRGIPVADVVAIRQAAVPLGRGATPDECAGLVCFLLSDDAGYLSGQAVNQDGGMVM